MKYTLFCQKGELFKPQPHFLLIGDWLQIRPDIVILQHGQISELKLKILSRFDKVAVFHDSRYHTLTIENRYNEAYHRRVNTEELQQFVGYLYRIDTNLFEGKLDL